MSDTVPNKPSASITIIWPARDAPLRKGECGSIGDRLGTGTFGTVFECSFEESGVQAVAKFNEDDRLGNSVKAEFDILALLDGANGHTPRPLGLATIIWQGQSHTSLVESRMEGRSLKNLVEKDLYGREGIVDASYCSRLGLCMLDAISEINSRGIRHGDLSYTNVILSTNGLDPGCCSVIDFGQSAEIGPNVTSSRQGTVAFSAPEMFGGEFERMKNQPASDMYSIGALLYYARLWGRFETHKPGSYMEEFPSSSSSASSIVAFKRNSLDLVPALKKLGVEASPDDRKLGALIYDLTSFDPKLRPKADECQARLLSIEDSGLRTGVLRYRARTSIRALQRALEVIAPHAKRLLKFLISTYLLFTVVTTIASIIFSLWSSTIEVDEDDLLWKMIHESYHEADNDEIESESPVLMEHRPKLSLGHLDVSSYGNMIAFYDSPKYISSDGYDKNGNMSFSRTQELLIVEFPTSSPEDIQPITWCENAISFYDSARGGTEYLGYHYLTPSSSSELYSISSYLGSRGLNFGVTSTATYDGVDYVYAFRRNEYTNEGDVGGSIAIACYAQRSDTCILEACLTFTADQASLDSVSIEDLLDDLLGRVQIKTSNFDEVSACSPFGDIVIVSKNGKWKARVKRDQALRSMARKEAMWYFMRVALPTDLAYSDSFSYDFSPDVQMDDLLQFSDLPSYSTHVLSKGTIESDDFDIRWSLANSGRDDSDNLIRVCIGIDDSCLLIYGIVSPAADPEEVARSLVLDTVEVSKR